MELKNMLRLPLVLLAMVLLLAGCEQENEPPVGSLTVTVQDASDSKTVGPEGNADISAYVITLSDGMMEVQSDLLEKGEAYTATNIPVGMWTAKVDGYVENEAAEGGRVLVASSTSDPVRVSAGGESTISVVLKGLVEAVSGDVTVTLQLPTSFTPGSDAYVIWTVGNGEVEHSIGSWDDAQALTVAEDFTVELVLDADNLLGRGEMLHQGVWDLSVTARTSRSSSTNECGGKDVMRLLAGLPATGKMDLSGSDASLDEGFDVTIGTDLGQLQEFGFSLSISPEGVSLAPVEEDMMREDGYSFRIDGSLVGTDGEVWYEYVDERNNERFLIHGLQSGSHSMVIVFDDGMPYGASSISLRFDVPEYVEVTVEYEDLIGTYVIPEGHVNYGFADAEGNYVDFPYTGYFEDMNGDGYVQLAEMGLRPLDYPFREEDGSINAYVENGAIMSVRTPRSEDFPSIGDNLYIAFAEGPTDVGYTATSGKPGDEFTMSWSFTDTVYYRFPKSIERFGRFGFPYASISSSVHYWTFQSIVEDDFSSEMSGGFEVPNCNITANVRDIDFAGSPYVIEDGMLKKVTDEGNVLIGLMGNHADELKAALVDGNKIELPDDVVELRPYALSEIWRLARDIEGGAILVMPPGLKRIDAPLVVDRDMAYFKAIIFNEGFEHLGDLGGTDWNTWSGANDDSNSLKIYLPSTLKSITQQEFSSEYSTPEFYVALPAEGSLDWQRLLSYDATSQDAVIYFNGEWSMGADGVPVADKIQTTDMRIRLYNGTYYLNFYDLFFARIEYRYEYTVDGSDPADPTESSAMLDPQEYDGYSYYSGGYELRDVCPLWDVDKPLQLKIRMFNEGSGPSDVVTLSNDPQRGGRE